MPDFKDKLTEKQESFAKGFGKDLLTMSAAAKQAGYSDPHGEIDRLFKNRALVAKVVEYLRAQAVKWQVLVAKAKTVLMAAMEAEVTDKAGNIRPDMRIRLDAARVVLLSLKKDGKHLLEDAANEEDAAAQSNIDLAKNILGPITPGEPIH